MLLGDLLKIKPSLERLMVKQFNNFKVVRQLAFLAQAINDEIKFYTDQETLLIKEYAEFGEDGNLIFTGPTTIKMKDAASHNEFESRLAELQKVDVSDKIKKVTIHDDDFKDPDDLITPADLVILLPVIDFE